MDGLGVDSDKEKERPEVGKYGDLVNWSPVEKGCCVL